MESRDQGVGPAEPEYLVVGRLGRAHGIHGEVRVDVLTDFPERRFHPGAVLLLGAEGEPDPMPAVVVTSRPHAGYLLVRFDAAADRTAAEQLVGLLAMVPIEDAAELGPDAYYVFQLVGLEVATADGASIGRVTDVMETGAADVLLVMGDDGRTRLLPMTGEVIAAVDLGEGRVTVTPIPGLLD